MPKAETKPLRRYTRRARDTHDSGSLLQCRYLCTKPSCREYVTAYTFLSAPRTMAEDHARPASGCVTSYAAGVGVSMRGEGWCWKVILPPVDSPQPLARHLLFQPPEAARGWSASSGAYRCCSRCTASQPGRGAPLAAKRCTRRGSAGRRERASFRPLQLSGRRSGVAARREPAGSPEAGGWGSRSCSTRGWRRRGEGRR